MPSTASTKPPPLDLPVNKAFIDAYFSACDLLPRNHHQVPIMVGGAASIVHGMPHRQTEDVDIVVDKPAMDILDNAVNNRQGGVSPGQRRRNKVGKNGA